MLIVCDTHGTNIEPLLQNFNEEVDCVFTLGDVDIPNLQYLQSRFPTIWGILGNHDSYNDLHDAKINNLDKRLITIQNISFCGLCGSWRYKEAKYAPLLTDKESWKICKKLPKCDVFLSHDTVKSHKPLDWIHQGLIGINRYIRRRKPALNIHGHYHTNSIEFHKKTIIVGVAMIAMVEIEKTKGKVKLIQVKNI